MTGRHHSYSTRTFCCLPRLAIAGRRVHAPVTDPSFRPAGKRDPALTTVGGRWARDARRVSGKSTNERDRSTALIDADATASAGVAWRTPRAANGACLFPGRRRGHGVGRLQLPVVALDAADPCAFLDALFAGGARSVLVVGDSAGGRALLVADAVDRVVVDVVRDPYRPAPDDCISVGLPDGFQIGRFTGRRSAPPS
jgi:hypothetical protein